MTCDTVDIVKVKFEYLYMEYFFLKISLFSLDLPLRGQIVFGILYFFRLESFSYNLESILVIFCSTPSFIWNPARHTHYIIEENYNLFNYFLNNFLTVIA
jgi:hypothetical protein